MYSRGDRIFGTLGIFITSCPVKACFSEAKINTLPPLALISGTTGSSSSAKQMTIVSWSMRAQGPCLSSELGIASACIYASSLIFKAHSHAIGNKISLAIINRLFLLWPASATASICSS